MENWDPRLVEKLEGHRAWEEQVKREWFEDYKPLIEGQKVTITNLEQRLSEKEVEVTEQAALRAQSQMQETIIAGLRSAQEAANKDRYGALAEVEALRTAHSERQLEVNEQAQEIATLQAQSQMQETVIAGLRSNQEAATKERDGALAEVEALCTAHSERQLEVTEQAQEIATLQAHSQTQETVIAGLKVDQEAKSKERDSALAEMETLRTGHSERQLEVNGQAQKIATLQAQLQMQETAIACLKCDQEAASQERDSALAEVETLSTAFGKAQTDLDAAWKLQSRDQQQARAEAKASEDALGTAKALEESLRHQLAEAQAALRAKESECVAAVNAATRAQLIAKTQEETLESGKQRIQQLQNEMQLLQARAGEATGALQAKPTEMHDQAESSQTHLAPSRTEGAHTAAKPSLLVQTLGKFMRTYTPLRAVANDREMHKSQEAPTTQAAQAHAFEPEREATAPGPSAAAADAQIPAPALTALGVAAQVTAAILPAEAASQEPAKPCAGKKRALKAAAPAAPKKRPSKRARARAGPKDTVAADPKPARSAKPQATRKAQPEVLSRPKATQSSPAVMATARRPAASRASSQRAAAGTAVPATADDNSIAGRLLGRKGRQVGQPSQ